VSSLLLPVLYVVQSSPIKGFYELSGACMAVAGAQAAVARDAVGAAMVQEREARDMRDLRRPQRNARR